MSSSHMSSFSRLANASPVAGSRPISSSVTGREWPKIASHSLQSKETAGSLAELGQDSGMGVGIVGLVVFMSGYDETKSKSAAALVGECNARGLRAVDILAEVEGIAGETRAEESLERGCLLMSLAVSGTSLWL